MGETRKAEERDTSARLRRDDRLIYYARPIGLKQAAYSVMEEAYMAASAGGTLPANPRQIMYAARPKILAISDKDHLDSQYFCQTLLVNYIHEHGCDWDVVWDDRGHFAEPHTDRRIGLGTLAVRRYVASYASPGFEEAGFAEATIETYGPQAATAVCSILKRKASGRFLSVRNWLRNSISPSCLRRA